MNIEGLLKSILTAYNMRKVPPQSELECGKSKSYLSFLD